MMYEQFHEHARKVAEEFRKVPRDQTIRVVSHFDCDGICSCAILLSALNRDNRKYSISIIKQLDERALHTLAAEDYKYYMFTDLGSGSYPSIKKILSGKEYFILDHHELEEGEESNKHLNPHFFNVDGSKEISGAGVVYLFARALDRKNKDMAHIAIVGAIGDIQAQGGFLPLNKEILNDAVEEGNIEVVKEIDLYGRETRPIHKALEYCSDPYIPGVSGSESGAIQMLQESGINPKKGTGWKKYVDLTNGEKQRLASSIILRRLDEPEPEEIFGYSYIVTKQPGGSPLRDAKEFSTLLNACGRMGKASLGIGACLGIKAMKQKAMHNLRDYKREIVKAMQWYENNSGYIEKKNGYIIINAGDQVMSTIIGTMASILSKSGKIEAGTYIMSLARADHDTTKISMRVAGIREQKVDLREIVSEIVGIVGGEFGGHAYAAGAVIPSDLEDEFISCAKEVMARRQLEEKVV